MSIKLDGDWVIHVITLQQTLAGAAGGLVRWLLSGGNARFAVASILIGAVCGRYLAPIVGDFTGVSTSSELADAFIMGVTGAVAVQWILNIAARAVMPSSPVESKKEPPKSP